MAQTILVVDDHANVRTLIKEYLTEVGYRIVSAGDGAAALAAASREPIDLITVAVQAPNVLVVPAAAVYHEGDNVFVVVAGDDGKSHRKNVKTGIVTHEKAQILSGIVAGEKVILSGAEPVPDGAAITIGK